MVNFSKHVIYKPHSGYSVISCKLGLWEVKGPYDLTTIERAEAKYRKYRDLGKYKTKAREKSRGNSNKLK